MATASRNRISSLQARFVASDQDVSSLPGPGLCRSVLELVTFDNAQLKYSTVQNWYPGVDQGKGGIYNFVTKRGKCLGVSFLRWHWRTTINKRMPYWNARV